MLLVRFAKEQGVPDEQRSEVSAAAMQFWLPGPDEPYQGGGVAGLGGNEFRKGGGRAQVRAAKVAAEIEKAAICVTKVKVVGVIGGGGAKIHWV